MVVDLEDPIAGVLRLPLLFICYLNVLELALGFELFAHGSVEEVLECQVDESPRPYELDDVYFFLKFYESCLQSKHLSFLPTADKLSW